MDSPGLRYGYAISTDTFQLSWNRRIWQHAVCPFKAIKIADDYANMINSYTGAINDLVRSGLSFLSGFI